MKILHLVHSFAPEAHGGTQGYVLAIARGQAAAGHAVRVFTASENASEGARTVESDHEGLAVTRFFRDLAAERLSGDLGSARIAEAITDHARRFAPDLVHVHHWHGLTRELVTTLKREVPARDGRPVRVVVSLHDLFTTCPRHFRMPDSRRFCADDVTLATCAACIAPDLYGIPIPTIEAMLGERLDRFQDDLAAADRVFTMSEAQRHLLLSLARFRATNAETLPIGVPEHTFALAPQPPASRGEPASAANPLRIVHWAGIDPRKGAHVLVDALARTANRDAITVDFFGKDGEAEFMSELRGLIGSSRVRFHGRFADADRPSIAAGADLTVLPFLSFETYGLVVDEALALGLPVVVSDRGAPKERIGGRGVTFPAGDATALAAILDGFARRPADLHALRRGAHGARPLEDHLKDLLRHYHALVTV